MKIGSQCFCFVFVACLGGFWFVLLLFSPSKWTGHPSSPLPNCSMPYCSHKFLQYFYWPGCQVSITPWLHPCQVYGAIPHPPAECWGGGPHLEPSTPLAEMECILRCLFGVRELHENPFGTSTCLLRRTLLYTKGQPWCFCHFFSSKCLSSITGMPFKSIANTLILSFNQILAMFSIYKLTLIHTNPFSASRTAILSPFFKPVTILPFMSKPSSTINCFT